MNQIFLKGKAGQDAKTRSLTNGQSMTTFSLATSRKQKESWLTQWHNIICFAKLADKSALIKKGDTVVVVGEFQTREFEGKDGIKKTTAQVLAREIVFEPKTAGAAMDEEQPVFGEDLPF